MKKVTAFLERAVAPVLFGLLLILTGSPRWAAAALVNRVSLDRERMRLAIPPQDPRASALATASASDLERLGEAHRLDPASQAARRELAQALLGLGQIDEALGVLGDEGENYLLLTNDQRPEGWLLRACLLAQKGQFDEAISNWRYGADLAVQRWPASQYRLVEASGATLYQFLLEQQPGRMDWRSLRARLLWRSRQPEQALQEFATLANLEPQTEYERHLVGEALFMLASTFEKEPSMEAAETLERALAFHPRLVPAYALLESIYAQSGQAGQAATTRARLDSLSPQWPVVGGGQEALPGWILYGYDLETLTVEEQPLLRLQLYWRLPAGTKPEGPGWYRAGDHWIQLMETFNLASNAGFEQDLSTSTGAPTGYELYEGTPPASQQLVLVQREGVMSHVLRQSNITKGPSVGVWLMPMIKVTANYYFLAAWVKSITPQSASGRFEWFDTIGKRLPGENYPLLSNVDPGHIAQIQAVLPGAQFFKFSLFNSNVDETDWDEILLVPIRIR
jgi:tetratricopeptide (TPR) repeat protein